MYNFLIIYRIDLHQITAYGLNKVGEAWVIVQDLPEQPIKILEKISLGSTHGERKTNQIQN